VIVPVNFRVVSSPPQRVRADLLAVPVGADRKLGPGADAIDAALDGGLRRFMKEAGFDGKPGQTLVVPGLGRLAAGAGVLVGVGSLSDVSVDGIRRAAAAVARSARKAKTVATTLVDVAESAGVGRDEAAQALAEGAVLGAYRFVKYKGDGDPSRLERVLVVGRGGGLQSALDRGATVAGAVTWARDIVNEPSAAKSPAAFAAAARRLLRGTGVTVKVLTEKELVAEGLGGILGVGQGSDNPPRLVKLTYRPQGAERSLALVGKGVVFF
jgi:leucyl aminopeptidase